MNASEKTSGTRALWIAIGVLALLNVLSLAALWMQRGHGCEQKCDQTECSPDRSPSQGPPPPHEQGPPSQNDAPRGPAAFEFIVAETHMDAAQRSAYEQLRNDHQRAIRPLRDSVHSLRETLFRSLTSVDENLRQQQIRAIAQLQATQDSITVRHFQQVRALLHSDQQSLFDSIINEATRMMGGPPPPHDRGPHRE